MKNIKLYTVITLILIISLCGCRVERDNPNDPLSILNADDSTAPAVESIIPSDNSEGVELDRSITVKFSETMNRETTESAFSLTGRSSLGGTFEWADYDKAVTFSTDAEFGLYNEITASISSTATDVYGNTMAAVSETFTTRGPIGVLDEDFDGDGKIFFKYPEDYSISSYGYAIAVDSDGKILVTGVLYGDMTIWRYNPDGSLDTSFNGKGYVRYQGVSGFSRGSDIAIDADGKIVVVGSYVDDATNNDMMLWRYTANGVLDTTTFGFGGTIFDSDTGTPGFNGSANSHDFGYGLCIDDAGRIYVTGSSNVGTGFGMMTLWRWTAGGVLDTTFSADGFTLFTYSDGGGQSGAACGNAVSIDSDGNILVAGYSSSSTTESDIVVWRYDTDGNLDTTFSDGDGSDGYLAKNGAAGATGKLDQALDLYVGDDNKIYVTGYGYNSQDDREMVLMKITEEGDWDTSFNSTGWTTHRISDIDDDWSEGYSLTLDIEGKILVAGGSILDSEGYYQYDPTVWRYNSDGTLDESFNEQGWVTSHEDGDWYMAINDADIIIDSENRIIAAGVHRTSDDVYEMAIWRYE